MEIVGYIASLLMGLSLGMVGGGGSILTVPILVYLFRVDPLTATSSSLFIVGATAVFGAYRAHRKRELAFQVAAPFAVASFVGVFLSRYIVLPRLPDIVFSIGDVVITKATLVMGLFAVLMLLAAWSMLRRKAVVGDAEKTSSVEVAPSSILMIAVQGFAVGAVTGFVGAGGGFLIVPALIALVGLPVRKAMGTSLLIIALNSLFGFVIGLSPSVAIPWVLMMSVLAIAIVGLWLGTLLAARAKESQLRLVFGVLVLVTGSLVFIDQLRHL